VPPGNRRGGFVLAWLPVLAYIALIFFISSQPQLAPPFHFTNGDKLAHTLEYGGLGFLLVRAFRTRPALGPVAGGLLALAIGLAIAGGDEIYQRSIPGRTSSADDWLADGAGLVFAQLAWLAIRRE
jgi:VanZ family protein